MAELAILYYLANRHSKSFPCQSVTISVEAGEETHRVCFLAPFYFCFKLFHQLIGYYDLAKAGKATMKNKIGKILWSQRMDGLS